MIITGFIYKPEHKASALKISGVKEEGERNLTSPREIETAKTYLTAFIPPTGKNEN